MLLKKIKGNDASQREKRSPDRTRAKVKLTMEQQLLKLDEAINQSLKKELILEPSLFHNGEPVVLTDEEFLKNEAKHRALFEFQDFLIREYPTLFDDATAKRLQHHIETGILQPLIQYPKLRTNLNLNLNHVPDPLTEEEQGTYKVRTKRVRRSLNNDDLTHTIIEDFENLKKKEKSPKASVTLLKNALENYAVYYHAAKKEDEENVKENEPKTSPSKLEKKLSNDALQIAGSLAEEIEEQLKFEPKKLHTLTALYGGDGQVNYSPKARSLTLKDAPFYERVQFQDPAQTWSSPIGDHLDLQAQ
uniref:Uncharacterized protein n=1 Tax=Trichogramma kaykai TaxID=54128 RepID=A0ABD2W5J0_9HYME